MSVDLQTDQLSGEVGQLVVPVVAPAILDKDVLAFDPPELPQPLQECVAHLRTTRTGAPHRIPTRCVFSEGWAAAVAKGAPRSRMTTAAARWALVRLTTAISDQTFPVTYHRPGGSSWSSSYSLICPTFALTGCGERMRAGGLVHARFGALRGLTLCLPHRGFQSEYAGYRSRPDTYPSPVRPSARSFRAAQQRPRQA